MRTHAILRLLGGIPLVILLACATGCQMYQQEKARREMQEREDLMMVQEDSRRLTGRVESLEMELERLDRELAGMRNEITRSVETETGALDERMRRIEGDLQRLERAREQDKQEIIDSLSKKIAQVMQSAGSGGTARRQNRRSEYGYEHVVQTGETLSEIAAAYGVSVKSIQEENDIRNPNQVRVGQKLFIPE